MEIDALRQIPLADFLTRLGHEPIRRRGNEWWYAAPYRTERTPSFRVNVDKQLWYDFGLGKGGDIFTLAGEFVHSNDFMEQARFITEAGIVPLPQIEPRPHKTVEKKPVFEEMEIRPLSHRALLSYLEERGIAPAIAQRHCKEVHFRLYGKRYFAIVAEDLSYATASSRAAYRQRTFLHLDREAVAATSTRALWIGFLR